MKWGIDIKDIRIVNLENEIVRFEREMQRLKEDYNKVVHQATELESRVYELEEIEKEHQKINGELMVRINKAIEYIENKYKYANYNIPLLSKDEQLAGKILEILKGKNK